MHAFLQIGGTENERIKSIQSTLLSQQIESYNQIVLEASEKATVGIADVRAFIRSLQFAPHTEGMVAGIIPSVETLTPQAQQALLKTIEEPPPRVRLYLGASSQTRVLATIVSRCEVTFLHSQDSSIPDEELANVLKTIESLIDSGPGDKITTIQQIGKTKHECAAFIHAAIHCLRTKLLKKSQTYTTKNGTSVRTATLLHGFLHAKDLTEKNINPYHLLENIFLPIRRIKET